MGYRGDHRLATIRARPSLAGEPGPDAYTILTHEVLRASQEVR